MRVHITFLQDNSHFNQAYADEYHWGEDSESNRKYEWLTKVKVTEPVKAINLLKDTTYQLNTTGDDGQALSQPINRMTTCECVLENGGVVIFAVSNSLLKKVVHPTLSTLQIKIGTHKTSHVYFYFKPGSQFVSPREGIYIDKCDMPGAWPVVRQSNSL